METTISQEEFNKLMKIKGEVRGMAFKSGMDFVLKEKGNKGLKEVEKLLAELGYFIEFGKIEPMNFYPLGLMSVSLLAAERLFGFTHEKFIEMGRFTAKSPLIIRLFLKYFGSLEMIARETQGMHQKYFTVGEVKVIEINKEEKLMVIRRENFWLHPLHCYISQGFYPAILEMVIGSKVSCEVTKSPYRGDEYHEFVFRW